MTWSTCALYAAEPGTRLADGGGGSGSSPWYAKCLARPIYGSNSCNYILVTGLSPAHACLQQYLNGWLGAPAA